MSTTTIYNNNNSSSGLLESGSSLNSSDQTNHNHNNNNISNNGGGGGLLFSSEDEDILAGEEEVVTTSNDQEEGEEDQHYNNVHQEEEVETEEQVGDFTISNNNHDTSTEPEVESPTNNRHHGYNNESPSNDIGVSRAGRVRKKNSLLAGYEFDTIETPSSRKHKNEVRKQKRPGSMSPDISDLSPSKRKRGRGRPRKSPQKSSQETDGAGQNSYFDGEDDADLEIDLPPEFSEADLPELAAEEIIDDMLDPEDLAQGIILNSSASRLKSQAESAYMMEKSSGSHRKSTNHSTASSSNASYLSPPVPQYGAGHNKLKELKFQKKERPEGHKRLTGYILWAQEQKKNFTQNFPHMDFNVQSSTLAEKWSALSANQKKLWKSKASKTMKGGVADNIKNSAKIIPKKPPGKRGRKSKLELLAIAAAKNASPVPVPPSPAYPKVSARGRPGKRGRKGKHGRRLGSKSNHAGNVQKFNSPAVVNGSPFATQFSQSRSLTKQHSMSPQMPSTSKQFRYSPKKEIETPTYKVTGHAPIDVAAHLSLLGESLSNIGDRLQQHAGENVSGTLSVLLDAFICATGPLLCLTTQVKELNCIPPERLTKILECFAINMPGI